MKVKEIDRTANVAWSPATQHPVYLVAGTAAQQLDASFSTTASLEIYGLNLTEPGLDMSLKGSISSDCRFHKIVWSSHGMATEDYPNGVIAGGADGGNLFMFDPAKLIKGEMALICQRDRHSGPVTALDFNPFQVNLLASGAGESEVFIWDLNSPNSPMSPGAKSQLDDVVTSVAWNRQVQHILASTFPARCVVWDLRKNEPIIKVSDSISRICCKAVAWHPEVATQLCLASEDDHSPVIQLWDLRFATSPLKSLENHQRGVLSIAWCPQDPDLLLSCGKDSRILCWNPNSNVQGGEVVWEIPTSNQWSFDVTWCPRNPAVIASAAFDGHVSIYSLMGGQQQIQTSSKIVDAFPGAESFAQPLLPHIEQRGVSVTLTKPPKWLRKPVGASFGFGGKLISFENVKPTQQQSQVQRAVYISQVVTETELISRSKIFESVLSTGNFSEFCQSKLSNISSAEDEKLWKFVKANFEENSRSSFLTLLGYNPQDISNTINASMSVRPPSRGEGEDAGVDAEELALRMTALGSSSNSLRTSPNILRTLSASQTPDSMPVVSGDGIAAFDAIASLHSEEISPRASPHMFMIPTEEDIDGSISKALLIGNLEIAVNLCLKDGRHADAIILAMAGGTDLLARTQKKYFKVAKGELSKLVASVVNEDWDRLVKTCDIKCWKEALAICLTYAKAEEFSSLCAILGSRLETENSEDLFNAMLCYICAGSIDKLVECWVKVNDAPDSSDSLQDLVELTTVLNRAVEMKGLQSNSTTSIMACKLSQYAQLLAAQGSLAAALAYLGNSDEHSITVLRDRLFHAQDQMLSGVVMPPSPFPKLESKPAVMGAVLPNIASHASHLMSNVPHQLPQQMKPVGYPTPMSVPSPYMYPPSSVPYQVPVVSQPTAPHPYPVAVPSSSATTGPPATPPVSSQTQTNVYAKGHVSQRYPSLPQDPSVSSNWNQQNYYQPPIPAATTYGPVQPTANVAPVYPNFSSYSAPNTQPNGFQSPPVSQFSPIYNPQQMTSMSSAGYAPTTAPPPTTADIQMFQDPMKSSWNDPPALKPMMKTSGQDYELPAPITRPIFNAPEMEPMASHPYNINNYNPSSAPVGNMPMPSQPMKMHEKVAPPAPEPIKPKGPIPVENQILYDIFESLRSRCSASASNPQTKRKLEDVARKLESLYDKLRENGLSQPTILGLHQIIQVVQQGDYQTALSIHSQILNMGNFSEFGSFMPSLKVLLQTSHQLNVYVT